MTRRTNRLGEQFRKILGELIQGHLKDPRIGFVTVTAVRVTPDLSKAHVYYTVLGTSDEQKATGEGLASASPFLRTELGRRIKTRSTPQVVFHYDDSSTLGRRVDEILHDIHAEAPREDAATESDPDEDDE